MMLLSLYDNVQRLSGCKVLVVDDDDDSINLIAFVLEEDGAQVMRAASVCEALEKVEQEQLDILLSDISLPDRDGYDLINQVRNLDKQAKQIPAIAITGHADGEDRTKALLAGYQEHLSKPFDVEVLVSAVSQLVKKGKSAS